MSETIRAVSLRRRSLLAGALASVAPAGVRAAEPLKITVFGQALIQHDLRAHPWPDFDRLADMFGAADIAFTDLETAITGPDSGPPTRQGVFTHTAGPEVLDCLRSMRVTMLTQANNHAFDLNTGGVLDAIAAMDARGFVHAGTGRNLQAAAAPAYQSSANGTVALVAVASGEIRAGGAATDTRPGVNEARRIPGTGPVTGLDEADIRRVLDSVARAAAQADAVILYHHNHYVDHGGRATPPWQQAFARQGIDAGAALYVSHGAPMMQGIELYRGQPIFYDLGSLMFQTATAAGYYDAAVWQSVIAECRFDRRRFLGATLTPVQLNPLGVGGPTDLATRGRPSIATGAQAAAILDRLEQLTTSFATKLDRTGRTDTAAIGA